LSVSHSQSQARRSTMLGRGAGAGGGAPPPPSVPFSMRDDSGVGGDPGLTARYDVGGFSLETGLGGGGARPGTSATIGGGGGGASRPATAASRLGTAATTGGGGRAATAASAPGGGSGGGSYTVVVLTENRAREVGLAIVDLAAAHSIQLAQLADTPSYSATLALLHAVAPLEVVVPKSQADRVLFKKVGARGRGAAAGGRWHGVTRGRRPRAYRITPVATPAPALQPPPPPRPPPFFRSLRTGAPTPTRCARRSAPSTAGEGQGGAGEPRPVVGLNVGRPAHAPRRAAVQLHRCSLAPGPHCRGGGAARGTHAPPPPSPTVSLTTCAVRRSRGHSQ
jgi:hypothetical protein